MTITIYELRDRGRLQSTNSTRASCGVWSPPTVGVLLADRVAIAQASEAARLDTPKLILTGTRARYSVFERAVTIHNINDTL